MQIHENSNTFTDHTNHVFSNGLNWEKNGHRQVLSYTSCNDYKRPLQEIDNETELFSKNYLLDH